MQFGDGNFLRAFTAWMFEILNERTSFNGGIQVIAPLRNKTETGVEDQDNLYHVVLNGINDGAEYSEVRLITSVEERIHPYNQHSVFLKAAESATLQFVVSNTTESGITFNESDKDSSRPAESFPGKLTQLLFQRYKHFNGDPTKGLVVIPCELIEKNGKTLKNIVEQYAKFWNLPGGFLQWVQDHNIFCDSLVDRIVTGYPTDNSAEINNRTGYDDKQMVAAEPYYLWVIEGPDSVKNLLPAEEGRLHVIFANDLTPYRTTKVRILNGGHTALMAFAYLRGFRTVRESVENEDINKFLREILNDEIIPTLSLPASDLYSYSKSVIERFLNPYIRHQLSSIALNSISKFRVRVLPSLIRYNELTGRLPVHMMDAFASLLVFYRGTWKGEVLPVNDSAEVMSFFNKVWTVNNPQERIEQILSNTSLWGQDLTSITGMTNHLQESVERLLAEDFAI